MEKQSKKDYIRALEKMKRSPRDRLGILGELGGTSVGIGAGAAISGAVAGMAGATTVAGSTTLGALLGGVFIATTPIGWVVGMATLGGLLGYGLSRLSRGGGESDIIKEKLIHTLERRVTKMGDVAAKVADKDVKMNRLIKATQSLVASEILSQRRATGLLTAVENGTVTAEQAFEMVKKLFHQKQNSEQNKVPQ